MRLCLGPALAAPNSAFQERIRCEASLRSFNPFGIYSAARANQAYLPVPSRFTDAKIFPKSYTCFQVNLLKQSSRVLPHPLGSLSRVSPPSKRTVERVGPLPSLHVKVWGTDLFLSAFRPFGQATGRKRAENNQERLREDWMVSRSQAPASNPIIGHALSVQIRSLFLELSQLMVPDIASLAHAFSPSASHTRGQFYALTAALLDAPNATEWNVRSMPSWISVIALQTIGRPAKRGFFGLPRSSASDAELCGYKGQTAQQICSRYLRGRGRCFMDLLGLGHEKRIYYYVNDLVIISSILVWI